MRRVWRFAAGHGRQHGRRIAADWRRGRRPYPPIWVGGESGPAIRRAARIGNLWYPIGSNNQHLLDTLPRLRAGIARLRTHLEEKGWKPFCLPLGVNLDQELVNLTTYQQAYSASARLITATQDMFTALMNIP